MCSDIQSAPGMPLATVIGPGSGGRPTLVQVDWRNGPWSCGWKRGFPALLLSMNLSQLPLEATTPAQVRLLRTEQQQRSSGPENPGTPNLGFTAATVAPPLEFLFCRNSVEFEGGFYSLRQESILVQAGGVSRDKWRGRNFLDIMRQKWDEIVEENKGLMKESVIKH